MVHNQNIKVATHNELDKSKENIFNNFESKTVVYTELTIYTKISTIPVQGKAN